MTAVRHIVKIALAACAAEAALRMLGIPAYILPPPSSILLQLVQHWDYFLENTAISVGEAGLGLFGGLVLGSIVALTSSRWIRLRGLMNPAMTAFQAMPILAFAPLITTWFGPGLFSKAVLSLLVCLPVIVVTISDGLRRAPASEIELFRVLNASPWQVLWRLQVPRARPYFLIAARLAVPLSMLGAIVGEFVGASRGLGFVIMRASYYVRTDEMFAAVLLAALASILTVGVISLMDHHYVSRRFV